MRWSRRPAAGCCSPRPARAQARIFERHRRWQEIARSIERPSAEDQEILHGLIYRLKRGEQDEAGLDWLAGLPSRYGTAGCVFGCTELHLVHRAVAARLGAEKILDPLVLVARELPSLTDIRARPDLQGSPGRLQSIATAV